MPERVGSVGAVPPVSAAPRVSATPESVVDVSPFVSSGRAGTAPRNATALPPTPRVRAAGFRPAGLRLRALGIDAPVVPVGVGRDGLLVVPSDVRTVGWWSGGALPGAPRGTAVLVGHVDSAAQGSGSFFQLRRATVGDRVVVTGAGGRAATYTVVARRQYAKKALPTAVVFGQGSAPRLVLVTCGGRFDTSTRHYKDNVVVFAVPAP